MPELPGISIIICVYNAGAQFSETLSWIKRLDISGLEDAELIFVDNNSSDRSIELIREELKEFSHFAWRIVREPQSGLTYARLKGIEVAKFDLMLFCDQDNWLSEKYLVTGAEIMKNDPQIAVLGGRGIARSDIELPSWFVQEQAFYAVGEQSEFSGQIAGKAYAVYGAGMIVRKSAFRDISEKGFRFFNMSRSGTKLNSGEDTEMCQAFHIAGYKIWYDARLEFYHFIDAYKLTYEYLERLKLGIVCSRFVSRFYLDYIHEYKPEIKKYFWLREFIFSIGDLFLSVFGDKLWRKRNVSFAKYLLSQRSAYDQNVKNIILICRSLEK